MTQKETLKLTVGTKVQLTQDMHSLNTIGLESKAAGKTVTLVKVNPENDQYWFHICDYVPGYSINDGDAYVNSKQIIAIIAKGKKPTRFGKADIEQFAREGSNKRLKDEINTRINTARTALSNAPGKDQWKSQMTIVDEQIRQMKLIHKAIKE